MSEDEALFLAAVMCPGERTPALALADWFDEHSEPELALALREESPLVPFLNELMRWDQIPGQTYQIHDSARPNLPAARFLMRFRDLFPTSAETPTTFDPDAPPPRRHNARLNTTAFLLRWKSAHHRQIRNLRELAASRAQPRASPSQIFREIPDGLDPFEWKSCLVHERLLCGRSVNASRVQQHVAEMRERGHPLAWLPLKRHAIEAGIHHGQLAWDVGRSLPFTTRASTPVAAVVAATKVDQESPIFAAVRNWRLESNGTFEAVELELNCALTGDPGEAWVLPLPDGCLASIPGSLSPMIQLTPASALMHLFGAARSGGAYNRGEYGAYGRLYAWLSLGCLAGCPVTMEFEGVAAQAERCEWFTFGGTNWFHDIAWDLGLICVRPDKRSVAILAATDTD